MVEKIEVSGGISRAEMLLASKKANLVMEDEDLFTGDEIVDKQTKVKLIMAMARK